MKFSPIIILVAFFGSFYSCKKEKLEGEKSILIGEWEWVATIGIIEYCDPDFMYSVNLTPASEGTNYQIRILEKGVLYFYEGTDLKWKSKIQVPYFGSDCGDPYNVGFQLEMLDATTQDFYGCVGPDTLGVKCNRPDFPFAETECEAYYSYFVRK